MRRRSAAFGPTITKSTPTYWNNTTKQLCELAGRFGGDGVKTPSLESLLPLPGVVDEAGNKTVPTPRPIGRLIEPTLREALENLSRMRAEEGRAMAADLKANCSVCATECLGSGSNADRRLVVEEYRQPAARAACNAILAEYKVLARTGRSDQGSRTVHRP